VPASVGNWGELPFKFYVKCNEKLLEGYEQENGRNDKISLAMCRQWTAEGVRAE
jgi:hypothetical protein